MNEIIWIRSHVERLLQDEWDACQLVVDSDGDYPFRTGTAACWVSVLDSEPVMVRVFAHATHGVRSSAKLLRELNDIEGRALSVSVHHQGGAVIVAQTVSPIELTGPVLAQALAAVGGVADDIGPLLASMFDGSTPYDAVESASEDAA